MTPTRLSTWIGVLCILLAATVVYGGFLVAFHRQERCVQAVLAAQHAHLSMWEAVERCQR